MNREEVIRMAAEAGMDAMPGTIRDGKYEPKVNALKSSVPVEWLERFAYLVAAAEREACLNVIDEVSTDYIAGSPGRWLSDQFLEAIRARSMP